MNNLSLKQRLIIILSVLALFIIIILTLRQSSPLPIPTMLSSQPTSNSQNASVFSPIKLIFDSPLDPSLISISSTPPEVWTPQVSGNNLTLTHEQFFHANQEYSVNIYYNDSLLTTLNFKTHAEQNDPRYLQTVQEEMDHDYPLATSFPYETSVLRVVYISPMTLEITLKSDSLTEKEAMSQIKSWVTKNGGDSTTHKYQVISAPESTPTPTESPTSPEQSPISQ